MFSLKNGKAVNNKFASQHFFGPNIALFKKKTNIITYINYYENNTKAVKL